jgi:hypothetical protein
MTVAKKAERTYLEDYKKLSNTDLTNFTDLHEIFMERSILFRVICVIRMQNHGNSQRANYQRRGSGFLRDFNWTTQFRRELVCVGGFYFWDKTEPAL